MARSSSVDASAGWISPSSARTTFGASLSTTAGLAYIAACVTRITAINARDAHRQTVTARAPGGPPDDWCGYPNRSWSVARIHPDDRGPRGVLSSIRRDRRLV